MRGFTKSYTKQILKFSAVYLMWNLKICQDAPNQGQDDLVLLCSNCSWKRQYILGILKKILPKSCCCQLTCNKWLHWKVPPIFERKFLSACPINEHRNRSHKTTILYRQSKSGPTFLHLSEGRLRCLDGLQLPGLTRSNWVCHTIQQNLLKKKIVWYFVTKIVLTYCEKKLF